MKRKIISEGADWTFELIEQYDKAIAKLAAKYELDTFPNQIEIITSEQMIDAYSATGMPLGYYHWSFGKQFLQVEQNYKHGHMGLAYEIVINSNPCIAYLLEENSISLQALIIAHACYGHNSFFKNNYLFKTWTNPNSIVDYLVFAKKYIADCEEKYGATEVEHLLDACHALMNYGVDRYKHPNKISMIEEKNRQKERESYLQSQVNELWRTIPKHEKHEASQVALFPEEPQENILYFIEKHAPLLEPWQREIVRIVRKIAQYFYPQKQTKVMNEGWATFWHYHLIQDLYNEKLVDDRFMLEFLQNHTNVIAQPDFNSPYYSGINPYTLGFNMFMDIKRMCENPTAEDKAYFPNIAGKSWLTTLDFAMRNFKDESFISQYLSPKLIRDLKLFNLHDEADQADYLVSAIHDDLGYEKIRKNLSNQYNLSMIEPNIQVYSVDYRGDRTLTLHYVPQNEKPLHPEFIDVLKHLYYLWGFKVKLEMVVENGENQLLFQVPE